MKVKQAKLAQALRGETSNIITEARYDLHFDAGKLIAKLKNNEKGIGPFVIFPANIAYLEYHEEVASQEAIPAVVKPEKRPAKNAK